MLILREQVVQGRGLSSVCVIEESLVALAGHLNEQSALGKRRLHVTPCVHLEPPGVATGCSTLEEVPVNLPSSYCCDAKD